MGECSKSTAAAARAGQRVSFSPRFGCIATREGVLRAHAANAGSHDECSRRSRQKASPKGGAPAGHDRERLCPRACQTPRVAGRHRAPCHTTTLPSGVCGVVGNGGAAAMAPSRRRGSASACTFVSHWDREHNPRTSSKDPERNKNFAPERNKKCKNIRKSQKNRRFRFWKSDPK